MSADRWDRYYLRQAREAASMSKDPSTKVGAVLVGPEREVICPSFNGFPRGIEDREDRYQDRELKYKLVVHAEANALLTAARIGAITKGCSLYSTFSPCSRCAAMMIQAGIIKVGYQDEPIPERWKEDMGLARAMFAEAGVKMISIGLES